MERPGGDAVRARRACRPGRRTRARSTHPCGRIGRSSLRKEISRPMSVFSTTAVARSRSACRRCEHGLELDLPDASRSVELCADQEQRRDGGRGRRDKHERAAPHGAQAATGTGMRRSPAGLARASEQPSASSPGGRSNPGSARRRRSAGALSSTYLTAARSAVGEVPLESRPLLRRQAAEQVAGDVFVADEGLVHRSSRSAAARGTRAGRGKSASSPCRGVRRAEQRSAPGSCRRNSAARAPPDAWATVGRARRGRRARGRARRRHRRRGSRRDPRGQWRVSSATTCAAAGRLRLVERA